MESAARRGPTTHPVELGWSKCCAVRVRPIRSLAMPRRSATEVRTEGSAIWLAPAVAPMEKPRSGHQVASTLEFQRMA